ncbi:MAG: hypothetical protein ACRDRJ_33525 [Streptosporangiaceae bacterium]
MHRELEIIRTDLHCTTVKIRGRDIGRVMAAAEDALGLGLDVWLSPELWNRSPDTTVRYLRRAAAAAEEVHIQWPGRVVFSVGTELTLFMRGIVAGGTSGKRVQALREVRSTGAHNAPLNAFLTRAAVAVREVFNGPVTYAALPFEQVDWEMFDIIGLNHYWREPVKDRYLPTLESLLGTGKPVVISEFGFLTRTDADEIGSWAPLNIDPVTMSLHLLPLTRRLVRPRVKTIHKRAEGLQARCLLDQLALLDLAGVDGAFVFTFTAPLWPHAEDPKHDLDTDSFSLVKSCLRRQRGTAYPDMAWEPKEAFRAVASYYGSH